MNTGGWRNTWLLLIIIERQELRLVARHERLSNLAKHTGAKIMVVMMMMLIVNTVAFIVCVMLHLSYLCCSIYHRYVLAFMIYVL